MSLKITYEQNFLVTDFYLLKLLLVALGFCSQAFIREFSRQNICSVGFVDTSEHKLFPLIFHGPPPPPDLPGIPGTPGSDRPGLGCRMGCSTKQS